MFENKTLNENIKFVNLGETVVLECHQLHPELGRPVWRKGGLTIFEGSHLSPNVDNYKYSITGDHEKGEYFLKVYNVTGDLQSFLCGTVTDSGVLDKRMILSLSSSTVYREYILIDCVVL